jgi:hypothetical protein
MGRHGGRPSLETNKSSKFASLVTEILEMLLTL